MSPRPRPPARAQTPGTPAGSPDRPATYFESPGEFRRWLEQNHSTATELWVELRGSHVQPRGLTWAEAVPEALCFGWIDSVSQRIDADSRRQRWTPRKKGSNWSTVNVAHVERLIAEGRMTPAGLAAFEQRRPDRQGIYSYERGPGTTPPEITAALAATPAAAAFFEGATASYRKVCVAWVTSAKQATTRERRLAQLVDDCANGRLIPSQRYGAVPSWVARARAAAGISG